MACGQEAGGALSPRGLLRTVTSAGSSLTRRVLFPPLSPPLRPFRVSNRDRSSRKGVVAGTLKELIDKVLDLGGGTLVITAELVTLVLEEDGTVVDNEEFFQSLQDNTCFLLLEEGQKWTQERSRLSAVDRREKIGIAKITLNLYKLNPKDFVGCLNVKATFYDVYSVSYDIKFTGAKRVLRKFLRVLAYVAQLAGQFLVYSGSFMLQWTEECEKNPFSKPHTISSD
ncbi:lipid transferase CIDEA [Microcaecilia unicolor]|uniref:Cell death activator CIDE-A n=1 Tax=Microcaecilia unicolor TaxID=1415580 RepID=A0A6P7X708_9AMPH|nr:cell death activator CIDE-A [Microcaecilia unicolor]